MNDRQLRRIIEDTAKRGTEVLVRMIQMNVGSNKLTQEVFHNAVV